MPGLAPRGRIASRKARGSLPSTRVVTGTPPADVLRQRHRAGTSTTPGLLGCPCSRCLVRTMSYSDRHTTAIEVRCLLCYGTCARCPRSGQASYARLGQDLDFRCRLVRQGLKSSVAMHVPPRVPKALYTGRCLTCIPTATTPPPPPHPPHTTQTRHTHNMHKFSQFISSRKSSVCSLQLWAHTRY